MGGGFVIYRLLFILLLVPTLLSGGMTQHYLAKIAKSRVTAGGGDCTGNETFVHYFENTDDADCSAGSVTGTNTGGDNVTFEDALPNPQQGTYSGLFNHAQDSLNFVVTSGDMINGDEGQVDMYIYLESFSDNLEIFVYRSTTGSNDLGMHLQGGDEIRYWHKGNGNRVRPTTTACNLALTTWTRIRFRWEVGGSPTLSVTCDNGTPHTNPNALTAFTSETGTTYFGDAGGTTMQGNMDDAHIYNTWEGGD